MNKCNISRRSFLKGAAAVGAFNLVPARVLNAATAPSNTLTRALIGFGAIASSANHLPYKGSRLVGLCDPDSRRVAKGLAAAEKHGWGKIKAYPDFMALLADSGVDIVHICTPPHWHAVQSVMAAKAGKDIWCEKPMTRTIGEGKRVMEAVRAKGRVFRLNTWFRFKDPLYGFGTPVEPLKRVFDAGLVSGRGEPVRCVVGRGQGFDWKFMWSGLVNAAPEPVPASLDWDMWLGPAPFKPYNAHRCHGTFRGYWDYDAGGLGDMAQHYLDPVQYLLGKDETSPVRVEYSGPLQHPEAVGRFDRITLVYADGTELVLDGDGSLAGEPFLRGTKASVWPVRLPDGSVRSWTTTSQAKNQMFTMTGADGGQIDVRSVLAELPPAAPQITDFMESVRTRKPFALNEMNGFRSCTIVNLAITAQRLGRGFRFDPEALRAVDDPAADRFIDQTQSMRRKWLREFTTI